MPRRDLRLGVLYPAHPRAPDAWVQAEDDYLRMAELVDVPATVKIVHTPWPAREQGDGDWMEVLKELGSDARLLSAARELRAAAPDVVTWACTSGGFLLGRDGVEHQADLLRDALGVPASSTSLAFLAGLAALECSRVAVASIYETEIADAFAAFLATAGVAAVRLVHLDHSGLDDFATWGEARLMGVVDETNDPSAEAIVIPETAIHTARFLEVLERRAGKPVLTANQVTVWHALRLAGWRDPQDGLGALFRC